MIMKKIVLLLLIPLFVSCNLKFDFFNKEDQQEEVNPLVGTKWHIEADRINHYLEFTSKVDVIYSNDIGNNYHGSYTLNGESLTFNCFAHDGTRRVMMIAGFYKKTYVSVTMTYEEDGKTKTLAYVFDPA